MPFGFVDLNLTSTYITFGTSSIGGQLCRVRRRKTPRRLRTPSWAANCRRSSDAGISGKRGRPAVPSTWNRPSYGSTRNRLSYGLKRNRPLLRSTRNRIYCGSKRTRQFWRSCRLWRSEFQIRFLNLRNPAALPLAGWSYVAGPYSRT